MESGRLTFELPYVNERPVSLLYRGEMLVAEDSGQKALYTFIFRFFGERALSIHYTEYIETSAQ